ncbi:MAG: ATP-binding protein, partial [Ferruginibacter sp.]
GLYQYNNLKDNFDLVREVPDDAFVYTIYQDTQGTIWVGTIGDGVYYFNPDSKARGNINIESIKHNNRIRNNVIDIFEDSNRTLWFSTEGTGITSYSLLTQQFENFTVKDGLPSNLIFKVLEDKSRNLWMSTSNGLVCFNPLTKKAITYTKENGLLSNQFNYNSAFKDVDGTMYFGCLSGLISFNPDIFKSNGFIPKLFITGLMINNSEITAGASDSILKKSILFTKDIKLNYTQNSISLDFAALTYSEPEMVQYEYKLEDQDKIWTHLPHNRRVYFTNIPSGDYIFRVKAFNSSGLASNEVTLGIEILPPWWASKWAYCSYILLFLSLIYYISKSYHNIMLYTNEIKFAKHEYEKEQELHQMKIDFFTDVAHEIRTPLTLIIGPLETVVDRTRNIPELKSSLQFMEKNTRRLLDLTNQLLDFRSMEIRSFQLSFSKTDISVVLQDIFRSFEPLAKEANLAYEIVLPEKEILAEVDVEGIIKILNNLFSNAIKYSKSKIHVSLIYNEYESQFIIEMESDGDMIPENFQEKIFEPFFRMSENDHQNGTGIGLTISRTLAELHRGVLFLKKTKDKNINIFVLVIPILQVKEVE